jgi:hypothetical protein
MSFDPPSATPATCSRSTSQAFSAARIAQLERELTSAAKASAACETLLSIPGVGLLTATAMVAATGGSVNHFKDAVQFSERAVGDSDAEQARDQYFSEHPEQPLLAFVINETNRWLQELNTEAESDKFVMMASMNLVNCIAATTTASPLHE